MSETNIMFAVSYTRFGTVDICFLTSDKKSAEEFVKNSKHANYLKIHELFLDTEMSVNIHYY